MMLVQIPNAIFGPVMLAWRKQPDNLVLTARAFQAMVDRAIDHDLADPEFVSHCSITSQRLRGKNVNT
jgi:hypothetical protein